MWFAIAGIAFEILGFVLMLRSTHKLDYVQGDYVSDNYVDPRTGKPPEHIEGPPDPKIHRRGMWSVIGGLVLQILDIVLQYGLNHPI